MVLRLRRSRREQRQQLRLIALSAALVAAGLRHPDRRPDVQRRRADLGLGRPAVRLVSSCCPMLFAVAVLRYRLYDLDADHQPRPSSSPSGTASPRIGYTRWSWRSAAMLHTRTGGFWLSLLATDGGRAGLPATAPMGRPARRPAGVRQPGAALRALSDFSRPARGDADTGRRCCPRSRRRPAARSRRSGDREATMDVPGGGRCPAVGWGTPATDDRPPRGRRAERRRGSWAGSRCAMPARAAGCGPRTRDCSRRWPTRRPSPSATPRWRSSWPTGSPSSTAPPGSWPESRRRIIAADDAGRAGPGGGDLPRRAAPSRALPGAVGRPASPRRGGRGDARPRRTWWTTTNAALEALRELDPRACSPPSWPARAWPAPRLALAPDRPAGRP